MGEDVVCEYFEDLYSMNTEELVAVSMCVVLMVFEGIIILVERE